MMNISIFTKTLGRKTQILIFLEETLKIISSISGPRGLWRNFCGLQMADLDSLEEIIKISSSIKALEIIKNVYLNLFKIFFWFRALKVYKGSL